MTCPNCGKNPPEPSAPDCPFCGVVFSKWRPRENAPAGSTSDEPSSSVRAAAAPAGRASLGTKLMWVAVAAVSLGGVRYFLPSSRAQRLFEKGARLKGQGRVEESRHALQAAMATDPHGVGVLAGRYLRTKLPVHPVSQDAVNRNIQGFNAMANCNLDGADSAFSALTQQYPDFEWPYANLAEIYSHRGDQGRAEEVARRALSINDCYVMAWLRLADIKGRGGDAAGRTSAIESALQCDPEDWLAQQMGADAAVDSDRYMDVHLCGK